MRFRTTCLIHIFPLRFSNALLSISYLLHVLYSYFSFIYVNTLHFYCLLWDFHSSFSLTSFVFFFRSCIQFAFLCSLGHLRLPNLSHSLTSHILWAADLHSVFSPSFSSLTHSSIMHTLCLMHTHRLLYTCRLQHSYRLRHIHCSMHASEFMGIFHLMCTCHSIHIPPFFDTGHFIHNCSSVNTCILLLLQTSYAHLSFTHTCCFM